MTKTNSNLPDFSERVALDAIRKKLPTQSGLARWYHLNPDAAKLITPHGDHVIDSCKVLA